MSKLFNFDHKDPWDWVLVLGVIAIIGVDFIPMPTLLRSIIHWIGLAFFTISIAMSAKHDKKKLLKSMTLVAIFIVLLVATDFLTK